MSSCLLYITTVDYGQFNSYIDVIYPDLDVNVLMKYDISGKLIKQDDIYLPATFNSQ
jgi:hypothetical protein